MKSPLETLLKLAQRRLDDLGIEAAKLGQRIDLIRMEEASLIAREQTEMAAAASDLTLLALMPAYRQRIAHHVGQARGQLAEAESTMADLRERLKTAYQEKSKFEELITRERQRAEAARAAAEQAALDEAAINRVGRD